MSQMYYAIIIQCVSIYTVQKIKLINSFINQSKTEGLGLEELNPKMGCWDWQHGKKGLSGTDLTYLPNIGSIRRCMICPRRNICCAI
jgi:hypothetical protein